MTRPLILLSFLAAFGVAPALAQQAEGETGDGEGQTNGNTSIGGGLDLGEPDGAGTQGAAEPETYVRETYQDWSLQCLDVPEEQGEDICQIYQLLEDQQGASVAEVSIFKLENGGPAVAGGTFVVPLETLLGEKLSVSVDGGQARRYDYSFCAQVGCYARVGFTAEDVARFKAGAVARVTLVPALAPDQTVELEMSLSGFTAAFDEASVLSR